MAPELTWHFSVKPGAQQKPVVGIVHNFAGTQDNFAKHVDILNDLGFDVVTFDLNWHKHGHKKIFTKFLMPYWADEIKAAFDEILKSRELISFSFSGLSFCVLNKLPSLMNRYPGKIKALIFDSGPFKNHVTCIRNMVQEHFKIQSALKKEALTLFLTISWGVQFFKNISNNFIKILALNPMLPVLSIQGAKDTIVPKEFIHACFINPSPQIFTEVIFDKGGHLTSLKEEPEKYKEALAGFLK